MVLQYQVNIFVCAKCAQVFNTLPQCEVHETTVHSKEDNNYGEADLVGGRKENMIPSSKENVSPPSHKNGPPVEQRKTVRFAQFDENSEVDVEELLQTDLEDIPKGVGEEDFAVGGGGRKTTNMPIHMMTDLDDANAAAGGVGGDTGKTTLPKEKRLIPDPQGNEITVLTKCGEGEDKKPKRKRAPKTNSDVDAPVDPPKPRGRKPAALKKEESDIGVRECSFCRKTFASRTTRVQHERIHTKEHRFSCDYCPKTFAQLTSKQYHERTHTGEKPIKCRHCDMRFIAHWARTGHEKTKHRFIE